MYIMYCGGGCSNAVFEEKSELCYFRYWHVLRPGLMVYGWTSTVNIGWVQYYNHFIYSGFCSGRTGRKLGLRLPK